VQVRCLNSGEIISDFREWKGRYWDVLHFVVDGKIFFASALWSGDDRREEDRSRA